MCYRNFDWKLKYDSLLLLVRCAPPILFSDRDRAAREEGEEGAALAVELMQKEGSDEDEREA